MSRFCYVEQSHNKYMSVVGEIVNHSEMIVAFEIDGETCLQRVPAVVIQTDEGQLKLLPLQKQYSTVTVREVT